LNTFLVSQKHRVIYTPIAKNAHTTLKRMFVRLSGHPQLREILGGVHTYLAAHNTGLSLCDYTPEEASEIFNDPRYFRFVVLRDPLSRAVSGYLEKFVVHPNPIDEGEQAPMVIGTAIDWVYEQRGEKPDYERSITFEEFAQYLAQNDDLKLDTHFKSQESHFQQQKFDYMAAIEKMDSLIRVLGSQFNQEIEIEHQNRSESKKPFLRRRGLGKKLPAQIRTMRRLPHISELLNEELTEQISYRYAKDTELWKQALESE